MSGEINVIARTQVVNVDPISSSVAVISVGPIGPAGPTGPSGGPVGPTGPAGTPGEQWFTGAGTPAGSTGIVNDWYLNSVNGDYYEKTGTTTWTLRGNLKGPIGVTGPTGPAGPEGPAGPAGGPAGPAGTPGEVWFTGSGAPAGTTGIVGDWYLNSANGDYYEKTGATTWTLQGNLRGPAGTNGEKWFTGSGVPSGGTGSVSDWYLDSANGDYYEKTASSTWTLRGNLKGPSGTNGTNGQGIPTGGTTNQVLNKTSGTDYATNWKTLAKADVGLANVDNTSDANKPISTAQQAGLDGKQPLDSDLTAIAALAPANDTIIQRKASVWVASTPATVKTDLALTKGDVGLGNVDNTSDVNKPVSTATTTAINARTPKVTVSASAPGSPAVNDLWVDTT